MLNYPSAERFFEYCLVEAGVIDGKLQHIALEEARANPEMRKVLLRSLRDIQSGADAVLLRGKPAENTLGMPVKDWERLWSAWAASRKAAFFSRASMLMLGESEFSSYFIDTLRSSYNIVFLSASNDVLQHASSYYLNGPEEEQTHAELARWWEQISKSGRVHFS